MSCLRFLGFAMPMLAFGAPTLHPRTSSDAVVYSFAVTLGTTGQDGSAADDRVVLSGHASQLVGRVRIDFDPAAGSLMHGAYFLALDAGTRAVVVFASRRQYLEMPMQSLIRQFNASPRRFGGLDNRATDVRIDEQDVGVGPMILGLPTEHYQIAEARTVNGEVPDAAQHLRDSVVTDLYYAPALEGLVNPFLLEPLLGGYVDGLGLQDIRRVMAARASLYQGSAPLRAVSTETITNGAGRAIVHVATAEIADLTTSAVDPSIFDIPDGYSKMKGPGSN